MGVYELRMLIFELPADNEGECLRAAAIGSCRVTNPIFTLADRGDLKVCKYALQATHSAGEALQALTFTTGETEIPDRLSPYIFDTERSPLTADLLRTLHSGVDAFIVEISDDSNFMYKDIYLHQNFVSINLVRRCGGALLGWFREVCGRRPIDEARIGATLAALRDGGHRHDEEMADLLRNIRYERQSKEEIAQQLGAMMKEWGGPWTIVGPIDVPGDDGAIMQHRRALNEKLESAAKSCGAVFYSPSELVTKYGRSTVLDGGGADVYEYAPAFYPIVGETLVSLARPGRPAGWRPPGDGCPSQRSGPSEPPSLARSRLAERVNAELLTLHRDRLADLGLEGSGLGVHYQGVVERGTLAGIREVRAVDLIAAHLPAYDAYAIMRAGLGELALLIAANGRHAIAYEPHLARRAAIEAGKERLEAEGLVAPGLLTIVATLTPEGPLTGRVLGVGLDVVQVQTEAAAEPHFERLANFEAMLIDLPSFLRKRTSPEDQSVAVEYLHALGFIRRHDYSRDRLSWFRRK